jgi:phytoene dehydrogenase-like protein
MAECLVRVIGEAGGRVLVRANVREILVDPRSDRVTGVEMDNGTIISCKRVVSSAGYHNTFGKLVPEEVTERLEIPRRLPVGNSCGFLMANIGLRGSAEELGLTCANLWYHPTRADGDMFGAIDDFMADPYNSEHDPMMMVTFPSIKAREGEEVNPGKTTCQILCTADYRWFEKFAERRTRRRGPEYEALKAQWGDRFVKLLLRFYPQLAGHIELVNISTPLSTQHYLGSDEGGAVGLAQTPQRFTDWDVMKHLDSRTAIRGLWLTGQDTVTCGQPTVQGAGLLTAMRILGIWSSIRYLARTLPPIVRQVIADSRKAAPTGPGALRTSIPSHRRSRGKAA